MENQGLLGLVLLLGVVQHFGSQPRTEFSFVPKTVLDTTV
jgi:hypothetical protein